MDIFKSAERERVSAEDLAGYPEAGLLFKYLETDLFNALVRQAGQVSKKPLTFAEADVQALKAMQVSAQRMVKKHFRNIIGTIETRRENVLRYSNIQFVSIGSDCFSRTLLTRWGIKPPARLGEVSSPFDLAIHPATTVLHLLRNDFADYLENLHFSTEHNYPFNTALNVEFRHDYGPEITLNDFSELKQRYRARIENFYQLMHAPVRTAFIYHSETEADADPSVVMRIFDRIREKRAGNETLFFWFHNPPKGSMEPLTNLVNADVLKIARPYPLSGYIWYKASHSFAMRGVEFEKQCIQDLTTYLERIGWADSNHMPGIEKNNFSVSS